MDQPTAEVKQIASERGQLAMGLVELAAVNDLPLHESPRLRVIGLILGSELKLTKH
jgi:hypothetical protein